MPTDYTTPDIKGQTGSGQDILWSPEFKCPEDSMILRRNVPVDIQNEDRFSPVNSFGFNPLSQDIFSLDTAALILLIKLCENPKIQGLAKLYIQSVTKILTTLIDAGKSHPITALNAITAYAVTAHRFGIITDSGYLKLADQTRSIVDKLIQIDWANIGLSGLETLVEGVKGTSLLPLEKRSEILKL